ncbi:hypothetical protein ACO1KY_14105, partial [Staphylococcus aureus]
VRAELHRSARAANPLAVDLDDDDGEAQAQAPRGLPPELERSLAALRAGAARLDHVRDGYLASADGHTLVVSITPAGIALGLLRSQEVMRAVE